MAFDVATQLDLIGRLLLAAFLGALIGVEREIGRPDDGSLTLDRNRLAAELGGLDWVTLGDVGRHPE